MQLAELRYSKIDGTAVSVTVKSALEAKAALKELRHKKRELKFLRRALLRRQKAAQAKRPKGKRPASLFLRFVLACRQTYAAVLDLATVSDAERMARSPAEIATTLRTTDELLHNIEGCILQLEGKLLTRS
jgi:hypothetical protein